MANVPSNAVLRNGVYVNKYNGKTMTSVNRSQGINPTTPTLADKSGAKDASRDSKGNVIIPSNAVMQDGLYVNRSGGSPMTTVNRALGLTDFFGNKINTAVDMNSWEDSGTSGGGSDYYVLNPTTGKMVTQAYLDKAQEVENEINRSREYGGNEPVVQAPTAPIVTAAQERNPEFEEYAANPNQHNTPDFQSGYNALNGIVEETPVIKKEDEEKHGEQLGNEKLSGHLRVRQRLGGV